MSLVYKHLWHVSITSPHNHYLIQDLVTPYYQPLLSLIKNRRRVNSSQLLTPSLSSSWWRHDTIDCQFRWQYILLKERYYHYGHHSWRKRPWHCSCFIGHLCPIALLYKIDLELAWHDIKLNGLHWACSMTLYGQPIGVWFSNGPRN